jgi:YD repeat-containing protein
MDQRQRAGGGQQMLQCRHQRSKNSDIYFTRLQRNPITGPVGGVTNLFYTNARITRVQDPFGRFAQLDYDADGDLQHIVDMGDSWTAMRYNAPAIPIASAPAAPGLAI